MPDTPQPRTEPADADRSIDDLLAEHLPRVRAFVRLNVNDFLRARESCSDLVQSVCKDLLAAGEHLDYRDEHSFKNWLYTAVLNKIRDHERYFRAHKRDPEREDGLADVFDAYASLGTPSHHAAVRERVAFLEQAFDRLDDVDRRVITMARIVGLPHAEIARELGKSEGAARVHLSRALVRLSGIMEELEGD